MLLLLSDSALPLGAFAFSSGLESYLAHQNGSVSSTDELVWGFLRRSLHSTASLAAPFAASAYGEWPNMEKCTELDDICHAGIPCAVAQRASTTQGRALLGVYTRAFATDTAAAKAMSAAMPNAHLPVVWGMVSAALQVPKSEIEAVSIGKV